MLYLDSVNIYENKSEFQNSREVVRQQISEPSSMQDQEKTLREGEFTFSRCPVKRCCLPWAHSARIVAKNGLPAFPFFPSARAR